MLDFYIVKRGDSLWRIARQEKVYGDPFLWPLLYRYNVAKLSNPDIIEVGQVLIIFKEIGKNEARDARRKAVLRGDWRKWTDIQKRGWIEDWTR